MQEAHASLQEENDLRISSSKKPGTDISEIWISAMKMMDPLIQNIPYHATMFMEYGYQTKGNALIFMR